MKKGKVNTSKGAGYTPFSREDINLDDGRNTKAEELFLKMLDVPKRVQKKKKKGKETEIVDDDFYPTSMDETLRMENMLNDVESLIDDRTDSELMNNISWMRGVLDWSKKRHWDFAWWIVVCVFIMSLYYFYQASGEVDTRKGIETWSEDMALAQKSDLEAQYVKNIADYTMKLQNDTLSKADREYYDKWAEKAEEDLVELQSMGSWEEFREFKADQQNSKVWDERWSAIWCLLWIGLYIVAIRPYGYMVSKRRRESKIYSGLAAALFAVGGALFGAAASMSVTTYITTWSDGSKTKSDDAITVLVLQLIFMIAAVLLILWVARIVIVIATVMGFIRNYDLIAMAKKLINKNQKHID